jgi:hypothetical protein
MATKRTNKLARAPQPAPNKIGRPLGAKSKPVDRPVDGPYLTIPEFCALFDISRATFNRHLARLRVLKFGRRTLIPREEAHRYGASLIREPERPSV